MKKLLVLPAILAMAGVAQANLLTNGDFTLDDGVDALNAADWTEYNNGGWVNREQSANGTYGDPLNFHYAIGNAGAINNGVFQNVVVPDDGATYELTVDAAMDEWWSPTGFLKIEFLDAGAAIIGSQETLFIANGFDAAVGQPWSPRSVIAVAPAGTASINAVLGGSTDGSGTDPGNPDHYGNGGGTLRFDNADLSVVPEPASMALMGLGGLMVAGRRRR